MTRWASLSESDAMKLGLGAELIRSGCCGMGGRREKTRKTRKERKERKEREEEKEEEEELQPILPETTTTRMTMDAWWMVTDGRCMVDDG